MTLWERIHGTRPDRVTPAAVSDRGETRTPAPAASPELPAGTYPARGVASTRYTFGVAPHRR